MSYRDDLDAAHHRNDALEREVQALVRQQRGLSERTGKRTAIDWGAVAPPLAGMAVTGTFTMLAIALGWGLGWGIAGFTLTTLLSFGLLGATPSLPTGAIPLERELELAGAAGRVKLKLIAVVRVATKGHTAERARETLTGCTRDDVAEVAALALETLVRDRFAGHPINATPPDLTVTARDSLGSLGLELDKLWVGDA